jgi:hypothetical protein
MRCAVLWWLCALAPMVLAQWDPCPSWYNLWNECGTWPDNYCDQCMCPAGKWMEIKRFGDVWKEGCRPCTTSCPTGQYISSSCIATVDAVCSSCTTCPDGQYSSSSCTPTSNVVCKQCGICSEGRFISGCTGSSAGSCTNCAEGYYCPPQSSPVGCTAGSYCPGVTAAAIDCPVGNYCPNAYMTAPLKCGPNTYSATTKKIQCTACDTGKTSVLGSTECTCQSGTYLPSGSTVCAACKVCTPGTSTSTMCGATNDAVCTACAAASLPANAVWTQAVTPTSVCTWGCNAGYYKNGLVCTPCAMGTYSNAVGSAVCSTCSTIQCNSLTSVPCTATANKHCCTLCAQGEFTTGCTETVAGTCAACTN